MKQLCNYCNKLFSSWGETEAFAWKAAARLTHKQWRGYQGLSRSLKILDKDMSGLVTCSYLITTVEITANLFFIVDVKYFTLKLRFRWNRVVYNQCYTEKVTTYSRNNQSIKIAPMLAKQTRLKIIINNQPLFDNHENIFDSMPMSYTTPGCRSLLEYAGWDL